MERGSNMTDRNALIPGATEASATPASAQHAGGGEAGAGRRFSERMKLAAVQRLLRGESLEAVSRELNVPAHRLSEWRERALLAAEGALKEREPDARDG
jgi:transposase-like protein